MKRDLNKLADEHFDILIIGGGIHGAAIAREASMAGLKTALIEQKDFSHATSANSLKILHGGLRYLQDFDFKRMRISIKSQMEFMKIAPHLVLPMPCIIPTYGIGLRGKHLMRIALSINDLISWDRNALKKNGNKFEKGKIITRDEFARIAPSADQIHFNGAALWYDALVLDTERLTITLLNYAHDHGACIANYVKAEKLIIQNQRVLGVHVDDAISANQFDIRADRVVNAAGPWIDNILKSLPSNDRRDHSLARGLNIIVSKCVSKDYAIGLEGSSAGLGDETLRGNKKRLFFFVPWRGHTMIGTNYKSYDGEPDDFQINRQDIQDFIDEINTILPTVSLTYKDVSFYHAGLLPASKIYSNNSEDAQLEKHTSVVDHGKVDGISGLISVRSVKYTTAPYVAQDVLNTMGVSKNQKIRAETAKHQKHLARSSVMTGIRSEDRPTGNIPSDLVAYLESKYGKCSTRVSIYIAEDQTVTWISQEPPLMSAEVRYAIREEMASRLSDVVFRRTGFGNVACPSIAELEVLADIMGRELGWDSKQKSDELADVLRHYHPLPVPLVNDEYTESRNFTSNPN